MKKIITTIPFQRPDTLRKNIYEAVENDKLQYDKEVSFPVLAIMNGYIERGEIVEIITIRHEYENSIENYKAFCKETAEFEKEKECQCVIREITVPYNDLMDTHINTFGTIISYIEEEDKLYACMTYGSKPIPLVEMLALNYACRAKKNTQVGCIAYGQIDFNTKKAKIYDITKLFYMDEVVKDIAEMNVKDPIETIKSILKC